MFGFRTSKIILVGLFSTSLLALPAKAENRVGGLDLSTYCARNLGPNYRTFRWSQVYFENEKDAYTWRCVIYTNQIPNSDAATAIVGFDTHAVCKAQYGETAYGRLADRRNVYSWSCYKP